MQKILNSKITSDMLKMSNIKTSFFLLSMFVFALGCFYQKDLLRLNHNDTNLVRRITGETTWSGKITIDKTIMIMPGATLTITPGTVIVFSQKDFDGDSMGDLGILVERKGQILSKGTSENPIIFTTNENRKVRKGWTGITMKDSKECAFFFTHFYHGSQAIRSTNSDIIIYKALFDSFSGGIYANGGNVRILSSLFRKNGAAISFKNTSPKIVKNTFRNNKRAIFFMENSASGIVHENNFIENIINIEINMSEKKGVNLVQNFWNTKNIDGVMSRIRYDKYFLERGKIHIVPIALKAF